MQSDEYLCVCNQGALDQLFNSENLIDQFKCSFSCSQTSLVCPKLVLTKYGVPFLHVLCPWLPDRANKIGNFTCKFIEVIPNVKCIIVVPCIFKVNKLHCI